MLASGEENMMCPCVRRRCVETNNRRQSKENLNQEWLLVIQTIKYN